jgi:hypothetical protein
MNEPKKVTSYPFQSKAEIAQKIAADPAFAVEMFAVMQLRQTASEQESATTTERNKSGWMSSHAKRAAKIAASLKEGTLTEELSSDVQSIVSHYTKQLAAHLRSQAIQGNPELAEAARVFSAKV